MDYRITIDDFETTSRERDMKGESMDSFPDEYCMVDLETTGFSPIWDSIIEIGAIRYSNRKEIGRFQTLVRPPVEHDEDKDVCYVSDYIEKLTGITNEMLKDAPCASEAISAFSEFLGDSIILGYNVNFDVNFLYDSYVQYLGRPLTNNFVDIMRIAKKLHPSLPHHRLKDIVAFYGLTNENAHRTVSDCEATEHCYERLHDDIIQQFGDEETFFQCASSYRRSCTNRVPRSIRVNASHICGDESKFMPDCPFYQRHCVITGMLEKYSRTEALQIIADLGGIVDNSVTKKTNYLILGNNDYCPLVKDGKSTKQKKAEEYKLRGFDIEIISEDVFYDMISDYILLWDSET